MYVEIFSKVLKEHLLHFNCSALGRKIKTQMAQNITRWMREKLVAVVVSNEENWCLDFIPFLYNGYILAENTVTQANTEGFSEDSKSSLKATC